ncbi:MAG TPA: pyridoxal-dependent decarboxylase [Pyrinomonadaceae bacterium]
MDYKSDTADFLDCSINNLGDPFESGSFTVNSKIIEIEVLKYYAELWNLGQTDSTDAWWGYVSSAGCTEVNVYGLWNGRDYLAGKFEMYPTSEDAKRASLAPVQTKIPYEPQIRRVSKAYRESDENINRFSPVLFCSESTHYSVKKAADVLRIKTFTKIGEEKFPNECPLPDAEGHWPKNVPCNIDGSINIDALAILVEFFAEKNYPILINFNYGTTFSGAYDDVEAAGKKLIPIFKKYGLFERKVPNPLNSDKLETRTGVWFHVDGALGAAYMPFIQMAYENGMIDKTGPKFDFQLDYVHSISMSGHKWIGAPFPCGIYMTKLDFIQF